MRMSKVESKGENKAISIKSECKIKNKNRNVGDNEKGKCEDKATQERAGGHQRWGKGNGACMSKGEDKGK